jgi:hypothetical protein
MKDYYRGYGFFTIEQACLRLTDLLALFGMTSRRKKITMILRLRLTQPTHGIISIQ